MNLIIDIGNTRTKVGLFDGEKLKKREIWEAWTLDTLKKFVHQHQAIQRVAVSTVTYIWEDVENYLNEHFFYINLSHQTPIPIQNDYRTPKTLGKDRLAAVIGAYALFPNKSCLVIDAGTCIKYDILLADGRYLGGNIAPGIEMRLSAMQHFTARLPKIDQKELDSSFGYNTETAIRTGGQMGAIMEIQGFIQAYRKEFGRLKVILTGGDAQYFDNNLKTKIFVNQNLVLIGLNKIINYNVDSKK